MRISQDFTSSNKKLSLPLLVISAECQYAAAVEEQQLLFCHYYFLQVGSLMNKVFLCGKSAQGLFPHI